MKHLYTVCLTSPDCVSVEPVEQHTECPGAANSVEFCVAEEHYPALVDRIAGEPDITIVNAGHRWAITTAGRILDFLKELEHRKLGWKVLILK